MAICQALGVALAIGIGGALVALFVSAMASLEAGIDPAGTDFSFAAETWYLVVLFVLLVAGMLARGRDQLRQWFLLPLAAAGAIAGGASLAEEGEPVVIGLIVGALATAAAGYLALQVLDGAIRRTRAAADSDALSDAANTLTIAFTFGGIALAAICLFLPPAALLLAAALIVVAVGRRRRAEQKYEGLRILR